MIKASLRFLEAWHDREIEKALMVGDRLEDEEAAKNAGINFLSADTWRFTPIDHEF